MENENFLEFSAAIDPLMRRAQFQAACSFASGWVLAVLLAASFVQEWKPLAWLFLAGAGLLVRASFARYRAMRAQEKSPDRLRVEDDRLVYFARGRKCFSLSLHAISRIEEKDGIRVILKERKAIHLHDADFSLSRFLATAKEHKCDLYFEWFSPSVKARLEDIVHAHKPNHSPRL